MIVSLNDISKKHPEQICKKYALIINNKKIN